MKPAASGPVEGPWALPEGWRWGSIGEVCSYISRGRSPTYVTEGGVRIINQKCVRWWGLKVAHVKRTGAAAAARLAPEQILRAGDVLWNSTGTGTIGRACVVRASDLDETSVVDSHVTLLRASTLEPIWLRYWIELPFVQNRVMGTGSTNQVELSRDMVLSTPIPIPRNGLQNTILKRIDSLVTDLDDGEAALARARTDLGTWRKALLKAAVTGELTADWRAANPPTETGGDLLTRILDEHRARWSAEPRNKGKRYIEPPLADSAGLARLPPEWAWSTISQLASDGPTNGYSPARSKDGSGTLALKLTATTSGQMRLDGKSIKALGETIDAGSPLFLKAGDLLFQRGNTREYVGMAAVYDGPPDMYIYPDLMIRIRTRSRQLTDWIWRWSISPHGRRYLMDAAQGGAGTMPKITGETLRLMPVPLPPQAEQDEVLRLLDAALSAENTSSVNDFSTANVSSTLRQSILASAFRGELLA